jgi:hypothetical protein
MVNEQIDLVVLSRDAGPLPAEVEHGLRQQAGVSIVVHRVIGASHTTDRCRWDAIVRARNQGKTLGASPWLMFLDDDVALEPGCVAALRDELLRRPVLGAVAADYLGERRRDGSDEHVAMGATLFRRAALDEVRFRWRGRRCECQCCCDALRRRRWGICYSGTARARHLKPQTDRSHAPPAPQAASAPGAGEQTRPAVRLPSVCLVICYLGPLPGWIDYYLRSCAYNPSIDFLFFTDQDRLPPAPPNVRFERMTMTSFSQLASKTLGFDVELAHPYKLCDFRPAYGELFRPYLADYDYWGYGDLDVIYGDLRGFLTRGQLQRYDVFTGRTEYLVGHFTLLRNADAMRTLYRQCRDLKQMLRSPDSFSFDECGGQWQQRVKGLPLTDDACCDSLNHIVSRLAARRALSVRYERGVVEWLELPATGWRLRWRAGRLWRVALRQEAMYFHFNHYRKEPGFQHPPRLLDDSAFDITRRGFQPALRAR